MNIRASVEVMTAAFEELPFSELLHHPAATAQRLDRVRGLRLRRRDAEDLALVRMTQFDQDTAVVDFATRLVVSLLQSGDSVAVRGALLDALPWATFLPVRDVDLMVVELIGAARGAVAVENLAPIATLLKQWRNTAEIHADPALYAVLTREPEGDLGPVPRPPAGE